MGREEGRKWEEGRKEGKGGREQTKAKSESLVVGGRWEGRELPAQLSATCAQTHSTHSEGDRLPRSTDCDSTPPMPMPR